MMKKVLTISFMVCLMFGFSVNSMAESFPGVNDPKLEAKLLKIMTPEEFMKREALMELEIEQLNASMEELPTPEERTYAAFALNRFVMGDKVNPLLESEMMKKGRTDASLKVEQNIIRLHKRMEDEFSEYHATIAKHRIEKGGN